MWKRAVNGQPTLPRGRLVKLNLSLFYHLITFSILTFDLSSLITGYVPGGNFSFPTVLGTLSGVILTLNPDAPAGPNYNVTYTINSSSLTSFHGQDVNCEECTGSVIISFEITEAQIAGTAVSLAVCN